MADTPVPVSENLKRINAALALREIPDYPAALAQLTLALQADPRSALAQLLVGLTYQDLGHLQLAQVCFAQALELEPDSAQIRQAYGLFLVHLASVYMDGDDYEPAVKHLQKATQLMPDDERPWRELSSCYLSLQENKQAEAIADQLLQRDPNNPASWEIKCLALFNLSSSDKSYLASLEESLEKGIQAAAHSPAGQDRLWWLIWLRMRMVLSEQSAPEALKQIESDLRLVPSHKELLAARLGLLMQLEDWPRAEDLFKQAHKHGSAERVIAKAELGYIYLRQHKCELALEALHTAVQKAEDLETNLHVAAWVNGGFSKTKIDLFPWHFAPVALVALSNLATAYWLSGKPEEAFATIQEAIASAPQDNIGYRVSGCLRLAHGEVEQARSDWEKALDLAEDKAEAALIKGWLATLPPIQK